MYIGCFRPGFDQIWPSPGPEWQLIWPNAYANCKHRIYRRYIFNQNAILYTVQF